MRWDSLRLDGRPADPVAGTNQAPALFERDAVARTFDTPEFRGMTFYEVHARSIINQVPPASRMAFRWTINPYRGCSHSCVYCLWGGTPILMADGRTTPIAEVRVGDQIYGTVIRGRYRRYVITEVLAHWSTIKSAYRVTLEDGTLLLHDLLWPANRLIWKDTNVFYAESWPVELIFEQDALCTIRSLTTRV